MNRMNRKLRSARNLILFTQTGLNLVIALTISAILLWAITLMNGYFWFSTDIRMSLFLFWLGVSIIAVLYAVIPPLARPPSLRKIAIQFEREYVKKRLKVLMSKLGVIENSQIENYIDNFLETLNVNQRMFFDDRLSFFEDLYKAFRTAQMIDYGGDTACRSGLCR